MLACAGPASFEPQICSDRPAKITISGFGFATSVPPTVKLVPVNITGQSDFTATNISVTSNQIVFSLASNALLAGTYQVEVTNMLGCVSARNGTATQLTVHPKVVVYSVVPSVLAKALTTSVLVYVDGVVGKGAFDGGFVTFSAAPSGAQLAKRGTSSTPFEGAFYNGNDFVSELAVSVPYYVRFETQLGCSGVSATPLFTVLPTVDALALSFTPAGGINGTEIEVRASGTPFSAGALVYMYTTKYDLLPRPYILQDGAVRAGKADAAAGRCAC